MPPAGPCRCARDQRAVLRNCSEAHGVVFVCTFILFFSLEASEVFVR